MLEGVAGAWALLVAKRGQQISGMDDPVGGIFVGVGGNAMGHGSISG